MPEENEYIDSLADARAEIIGASGLAARTVAEMRRALAQMLVDLQADVDDDRVTRERAEALRESIDRALQRFRDRAVVILDEGRRQSIQQAIEGHRAGLEQLVEQEDVPAGTIAVADSFADVPEQVLETAMTRRAIGGAETMRTLVNRNVEEAAEDIDDAIESAIGRGVSQQRLTTSITAELAKGDDDLKELVRTMGREQGVDVDPDADRIEITQEQLDRANRLEYDARRIAVSEINSHYHEADVIAAVQSPVIDLLRWRTSSQHTPEKSYVPDICDFMEAADLQGYGEGLFHPAAAPSLVHPHCQCRYEKVFKEPENYGDGNRPVPNERELSETTVEEVLNDLDGPRSITEKYVQRQREMARQHLDAAREVADQLME